MEETSAVPVPSSWDGSGRRFCSCCGNWRGQKAGSPGDSSLGGLVAGTWASCTAGAGLSRSSRVSHRLEAVLLLVALFCGANAVVWLWRSLCLVSAAVG